MRLLILMYAKNQRSAEEVGSFGSVICLPYQIESLKKKKLNLQSLVRGLMPLPWAAHFKSKVKIQGFEGGRDISAVSSCKGCYSACLRFLARARSYGIINPKPPSHITNTGASLAFRVQATIQTPATIQHLATAAHTHKTNPSGLTAYLPNHHFKELFCSDFVV